VLTVRYAPDGSLQWANQFDGAKTYETRAATAIGTDGIGNVIVGSVSFAPETFSQGKLTVLKYAPTGELLWQDVLKKPENNSSLGDILVQLDGSIYVAGTIDDDFATIKLDTSGAKLWARYYSANATPDHSADLARGIARDDQGNVYVGGNVQGDGVSTRDGFGMVKYSPDGEELWAKTFGKFENGMLDAVAVEADRPRGRGYITGTSMNPNFAKAGIVTAKF